MVKLTPTRGRGQAREPGVPRAPDFGAEADAEVLARAALRERITYGITRMDSRLPPTHGRGAARHAKRSAPAGISTMTPTTIAADPARSTDVKVDRLVGAAHFVSHVFILVLPPVFPFVRAEFNVSYTELGLVVAVFNAISGAAADAGRLSGRPHVGAQRAGRRPAARFGCTRGGGHDAEFSAVRADVRGARYRQHRLSPGRLRAAVEPDLAAIHEPGLLDPHLRGLHRFGGDARDHGVACAAIRMAHRLPGDGVARRTGRGGDHAVRRCAGGPRGCARKGRNATAPRRTRPTGAC